MRESYGLLPPCIVLIKLNHISKLHNVLMNISGIIFTIKSMGVLFGLLMPMGKC
jgi:hypothetical protein